jgi:hypothetical protein
VTGSCRHNKRPKSLVAGSHKAATYDTLISIAACRSRQQYTYDACFLHPLVSFLTLLHTLVTLADVRLLSVMIRGHRAHQNH